MMISSNNDHHLLSLSLSLTSPIPSDHPKHQSSDHHPSSLISLTLSRDRSRSATSGSDSGDLCSQVSIKRERERGEDGEVERMSEWAAATAAGSEEREDEDGGNRKKLRLSREQSALLEESFKIHSTLNPKQKQALAQQLNLRPRQVEVWFQNRRARTKLKQTEVDCDYWKKCCETLTDENRRLYKELQELRALKSAESPFYMQFPAATLTMCPSCERISNTGSKVAAAAASTTPMAVAPRTSLHFFNPFANPSAAC